MHLLWRMYVQRDILYQNTTTKTKMENPHEVEQEGRENFKIELEMI